MPDLLIRAIDDALAERIKRYTREKGAPLNTCMLELLRQGLDHAEQTAGGQNRAPTASVAAGTMPRYGAEVMAETRILGGTWNNEEATAFREAISAIENIPTGKPL